MNYSNFVLTKHNTPEQLVLSSGTYTLGVNTKFFGFKSYQNGTGIPNVGAVRLGIQSGRCPMVVNPGEEYTFNPPNNVTEDLYKFWAVGNSGDAVLLYY